MSLPNESPNQRLRKLLQGSLSQNKLEELARLFDLLAQDRATVLPCFVLHHVCRRLAVALDGEAVTPQRFGELTEGIAERITLILMQMEKGRTISEQELESLVVQLFSNLALFGR
jgi:hypothetical protein